MRTENTISEATDQKVGVCSHVQVSLCGHVQKPMVRQEYVYTETHYMSLMKYK